jgi:peroxiredoxin
VVPDLARNGIALVAISYDSVDVLRSFAAEYGITYPLLSDEGSRTLRRLRLINNRVQEDHAAYGIQPTARHVNLPYPGAFVLDRDGVVLQKRFYESYRERDTGAGLIAEALGIVKEPSAAVVASNGPVTVRAWLDSATYVFFQRVLLTVEIAIASGVRVCAEATRDGLTPLSIDIDPLDGLEVGPARWPVRRSVSAPAFDDGVPAYQGVVRVTMPLTFAAAPGGGDRTVILTVRYQGADDTSWFAPSSVQISIPVREAALVGRSLPSATPKS